MAACGEQRDGKCTGKRLGRLEEKLGGGVHGADAVSEAALSPGAIALREPRRVRSRGKDSNPLTTCKELGEVTGSARLARSFGISLLLPSTPKKRGERLQELLAALA